MAHKTLIIGWDGATFDLIDPWVRAGYLPTVARLMAQGARGVLQAFPNMNSASAWSSIVTGCNPGKHGIFNFGSAFAESRTWHPTTARDRQRDPFWRILSAAGQRVNVLNVPISYPADAINGAMISGMDAPSLASQGATHPTDLLQQLRAAGIEYVLDVPNLKETRRRDPARMPASVREMVEARTRAFVHLLDAPAWDAAMVVYIATDRMQHQFWGKPGDLTDPTWTPLRELYRLLDAQLATLLARASADTTVMLISDHGFGAAYPRQYDLNRLFAHLGWLTYRRTRQPLMNRVLKNVLVYGRRYLPPAPQLWLAQHFPRWRQRALTARNLGEIDLARTQLYASGFGNHFSIHLLNQPTDPAAARAYDGLCERVCQVISGLIDPATGQPLVKRVRRRGDLYRGDWVMNAPDILVELDPKSTAREIHWRDPDKSITIPLVQRHDRIGGTHRSEGIFIAHGPHIRPGIQMDDLDHYAIVPTLFHLQGLPVPSDLDGRVLTELFTPEFLRAHPVVTAAPRGATTPSASDELSADDEAIIETRLRDLGYIE